MKRISIVAATLLAASGLALADETPAVLSPAAEKALKGLSSTEFAKREQAVKDIEVCIGQQIKALISVEDPEAQQRMATVLEFQESFTRWASDVVKLPPEKRTKFLDWGLRIEVMQAIAQSYSSAPEKRIEGVRALAALKDEEASWMLARLITDPRKEICTVAIEAVRDRKPTDEIVSALWQRSVESGILATRVRGLTTAATRTNEGDLATDVLVALKAPQVSEKLKKLVESFQKEPERYTNASGIFLPYNEGARNFFRIVEAYKTPEALSFVATLLDGDLTTRQQMTINGQQLFVSNRTAPLVTMILTAGQKPEDYGLVSSSGLWNVQWCTPSEKEESDAIAKFKKWQSEKKPVATQPIR